jgi:peptidoglycan/xylan/chitin deacetylase (PgdA/CDA1 family)
MAILTYHHIGHPPAQEHQHAGLWVVPARFEEQLAWLRSRHFVGLRLKQVAEALSSGTPLPARWVAITFDDGWRDNWTAAWPLLERYGFPATIFVTTGRLREGVPANAPDDMMSADEVIELARRGVEIGSHTRTHAKLTRLPDDEARSEIAGSRSDLAAILGAPPLTFAYPYGGFSPRVEAMVRDAGYIAAASTIRDNRIRADQLFHLPRVMVMGSTTVARFAYMFTWWYHAVHTWKNRRRWRIRP